MTKKRVFLACAAALLLSSCVSKKKYKALKEQLYTAQNDAASCENAAAR